MGLTIVVSAVLCGVTAVDVWSSVDGTLGWGSGKAVPGNCLFKASQLRVRSKLHVLPLVLWIRSGSATSNITVVAGGDAIDSTFNTLVEAAITTFDSPADCVHEWRASASPSVSYVQLSDGPLIETKSGVTCISNPSVVLLSARNRSSL